MKMIDWITKNDYSPITWFNYLTKLGKYLVEAVAYSQNYYNRKPNIDVKFTFEKFPNLSYTHRILNVTLQYPIVDNAELKCPNGIEEKDFLEILHSAVEECFSISLNNAVIVPLKINIEKQLKEVSELAKERLKEIKFYGIEQNEK